MPKKNQNDQIVFKTVSRKLGDLKEYPDNPRYMTEKQRNDLEASMDKFGLVEIPAINLDGTVIAGNQRLEYLVKLFDADYEIDVRIPNRQLTQEEAEEYNIRSNKNTGSWDWPVLEDKYQKTKLVEWGFEPYEIEAPIDAPEPGILNTEENFIIKCDDAVQMNELQQLMKTTAKRITFEQFVNAFKK